MTNFNQRDNFFWIIGCPVRQLRLDSNDWLLSRTLWQQLNPLLIDLPAFRDFLRWAAQEGLIEVRTWDGRWPQLKITPEGHKYLNHARRSQHDN